MSSRCASRGPPGACLQQALVHRGHQRLRARVAHFPERRHHLIDPRLLERAARPYTPSPRESHRDRSRRRTAPRAAAGQIEGEHLERRQDAVVVVSISPRRARWLMLANARPARRSGLSPAAESGCRRCAALSGALTQFLVGFVKKPCVAMENARRLVEARGSTPRLRDA